MIGNLILLLTAFISFGQGNDQELQNWPRFLGPNANGYYPGLIKDFSNSPSLQWSIPVGEGFSGPIVTSGTVFLVHRVENKEIVLAIELTSGKKKWQLDFDTSYLDDFSRGNGPRSTPAIQNGILVYLSPDGIIRAIDTTKTAQIWQLNLLETSDAPKGFFGVGSSPLLNKGKVFVAIGGKKAGLVCMDLKKGEIVWKSAPFKPGYASPVLVSFMGNPSIGVFHREGLSIFNEIDGKDMGFFKWRSRMEASVNAATPLLLEQKFFLTASYGTGAILLNSDGKEFTPVWSGDNSLSSHFGTPVHLEQFLIGSHGRQEAGATLRCIDWKNGKVQWEKEGFGCGSLIANPKGILGLTETGDLFLLRPPFAKCEEVYSKKILEGPCISAPALSQGYFLAKDKNKLVCLKVAN